MNYATLKILFEIANHKVMQATLAQVEQFQSKINLKSKSYDFFNCVNPIQDKTMRSHPLNLGKRKSIRINQIK